MWSYFNGFDETSGSDHVSGHSLPAVIKLKKENDRYVVIDYTEPKDGSSYGLSLKKMFPEKYITLADGDIKALLEEMDKKAALWLAE